MKTTHYTVEVKYSSGMMKGEWDAHRTCWAKDYAIELAQRAIKKFGKRNVRLREVTTKRIPVKA